MRLRNLSLVAALGALSACASPTSPPDALPSTVLAGIRVSEVSVYIDGAPVTPSGRGATCCFGCALDTRASTAVTSVASR